jgi:uncharacterized protein YegP (UPF0339 family)
MTRRNHCRWEVCKSVDGGFFARFVAGNGRKIVTTEVYTRKEKALHAITIVANSPLVGPADRNMVFLNGAGDIEIRDLTERSDA